MAKKNKIDELKKKIDASADEAEKANLQKQVDDLNLVIPEV